MCIKPETSGSGAGQVLPVNGWVGTQIVFE